MKLLASQFSLSKQWWLQNFQNKILEEDWGQLETRFGRRWPNFYQWEWLNLKFYERNNDSDSGFLPQKIKVGEGVVKEIPYHRKHSHYSSAGRFALEQHEVSYWARDHAIATCEATPLLRNNESLTNSNFLKCCDGSVNPDPESYGYLTHCTVKPGTPILDLYSENSLFFDLLKQRGLDPNVKFQGSVLFSRDERVYPVTQAIAEIAFKHNFGGLLYKSVRGPMDCNYSDFCLVLFGEGFIESSGSSQTSPQKMDNFLSQFQRNLPPSFQRRRSHG